MIARPLLAGTALVLILTAACDRPTAPADASTADALASLSPSTYTFEDLGTLGGNDTRGNAINASGQIAGTSISVPGCNGIHAFRADPGQSLLDLGSLPNAACYSAGTGINDAGDVAMMADRSAGGGCYAAARYQGGVIQELAAATPLTGPCFYTQGINASGQVVGMQVDNLNPTNQPTHPYRYTDGSGLLTLGSLGGLQGLAIGINRRGDVVGYSQTPTTPPTDIWNPGHAFRYTDARRLEDLNTLIRHHDWDLRKATAINDDGQIVGFGQIRGVIRAFLFTPPSQIRDLGTFPDGGISYGLGINSSGVVVGAAYLDPTGVGNNRAMIWDSENGMRNLNNFTTVPAGFVLGEAAAINDGGQITGWMSNGVEVRAFRLTPQ